MTWNDNGSAECGTITITNRMTSTSQDFLEIVAATTTGIGVTITVVSYRGPLGGTYTCTTGGTDGGPSPSYVGFTYGTTSTVQDCTITIDNPGTPGGAHATGTFSATVTKHGGGSIEVTNGAFDTPVMGLGG